MAPARSRPGVPVGRAIDLGDRGTSWILEMPGPPGAPVLLLLHGLAATAAVNWHAVFDYLRRRYHVIAFDHRGHGRGIRLRGRFRLADCADDAAALLDALVIDRVIAVGYSMGGPIAQLLWYRHRKRVAGLVLCATAMGGPMGRLLWYRHREGIAGLVLSGIRLADPLMNIAIPGLALGTRLLPLPLRRKLIRDFLALRFRDPEVEEWLRSEVSDHDIGAIIQAAGAIARFSCAGWINTVDVPTAVVVTERDRVVSPEAQRKLARSIQGATIHPVDGAHAACVSRPREFTAALLEACESVVARGRQREG